MLPVTKAVYHRGSHMEGTVALKIALRTRGVLPNAVVRSPLVDLTPEAEQEIADAMKTAGLA
jgi:4-hydroxy-tetrahydrodipicolinate synthase